MASRLDRSAAAAGEQDRQVVVVMAIAVGNSAAVEDHRVVEQAAAAFAVAPHPFEEVGQEAGMEEVDFGDALLLLLLPP